MSESQSGSQSHGELTDNFCISLDFSRLRNDRLSLVPFESDFESFSKQYVQVSHVAPTAWRYLNYGPWPTQSDFRSWYDQTIRPNKEILWFAIILNKCTIVKKRSLKAEGEANTASNGMPESNSKQDDGNKEEEEVIDVLQGTFAGITGLCHTDPANSVTELGHILIFPQFQRTFVATTAHSLILLHLLNPSPPDLHFRRVQWQAHGRNQASQRAAERLGFIYEGTMRWHRVLLEEKESELQSDRWSSSSLSSSLKLRDDKKDGGGEQEKDGLENRDHDLKNARTTAAAAGLGLGLPMTGATRLQLAGGRHGKLYGLCWDDWLDGGRIKIEKLMAR